MLKKIIYFSFFFFFLFFQSSSYVFGAQCVDSCQNKLDAGNWKCVSGFLYTCNCGGTTCSWSSQECNWGDCANGCECRSYSPTNTPTPSCSNTGGFCNNTTTCCQTTDVCFGNTCVDECDCVRGGNYCVNYCVSPGHADIWCYAAKDCTNLCGNILYNEWVGYVYCPQAGDESCHPATCHNAPDPEYCPGFDPNVGQCAGRGGNCDNCGGQDCGTCDDHSPPGTTPVPTSPPGCVESCVNPNVSPCITTTCSGDTCQGNCGQYCYGTMYCPLTTLADFQIRRGSDWFYTERNDGLLLDNPET